MSAIYETCNRGYNNVEFIDIWTTFSYHHNWNESDNL